MGLPFSAIVKYVMGGFNPLSWFAKGEPGAWYDPSDLTTLFQDSAGTTPVTAVEQPVGLMLDKSKGLALGAELVTNGDFSNGSTGWSVTAPATNTITISAGSVRIITNGSADTATISQPWSGETNAGKSYLFTFDILAGSSGTIKITGLGTGSITSEIVIGAAPGKKSYILTGSNLTSFGFARVVGATADATLDNISVKQIAGNHAFQGDSTSTPAKRPMLSARTNLLTKTEDFSNAVWLEISAGVTSRTSGFAAPDGSLTAYRIIGNNVNTWLGQDLGGGHASTTKVFSLYLKTDTTATPALKMYFGGGVTYSKSVSLTSSWALFTFEQTFSSSDTQSLAPAINIGSGVNVYIWHPDLRPTNAGALLPAYQRVNTASDYDTVGFPLYLKANGTSSAMSTNSIDFTATDKMTVVTGVRKLSDAVDGIVYELSGDVNTNNGSFAILAPISSVTNRLGFSLRGNVGRTNRVTNSTDYPAPTTLVLSSSYDLAASTSANEILPRVNSAIPTLTTTGVAGSGTGNFGNYPLYVFARAGTSVWFNGQFYGAIIRGAQSDTASVTQTENYMATKTGITF